jgi:hypothetical protein
LDRWLRAGSAPKIRDRTGAGHETEPKGQQTIIPNVWVITNLLKELGEKTGIKCNAHSFRRTFATESVRNGMNLFHVQSLLGHSSLTMTRIYAEQVNSEDAIKPYKAVVRLDWLLTSFTILPPLLSFSGTVYNQKAEYSNSMLFGLPPKLVASLVDLSRPPIAMSVKH